MGVAGNGTPVIERTRQTTDAPATKRRQFIWNRRPPLGVNRICRSPALLLDYLPTDTAGGFRRQSANSRNGENPQKTLEISPI
jgi:hypothetical protein